MYSSFSLILLSNSFIVPVIINFSFALVSATYSTLISSDITSFFDFIFIASLVNVGYSICFSLSLYFIPNPSSWCNNIDSFKSLKLNFFPVSDKNTTGNSRPLLLWILIILITLSFSPITLAADKSPLFVFNLSIKLMKLYNPLKLAFSYCFALSNSIFRLACLSFPFVSNPHIIIVICFSVNFPY